MPSDSDKDWFRPEKLHESEAQGAGLYEYYNRYAETGDRSLIESHTVTDDEYARSYATNLLAQLQRANLPTGGRILDIGCAFGQITNGIATVFDQATDVHGIDMSQAATSMAQKLYPDCHYSSGSADQLDGFEDGSIDLIHAREFYPFTRTEDLSLHEQFFRSFAPKLRSGGAVVAVQIIDKYGLADTFRELRANSLELGYDRIERHVVVPLRFFRHAGAASYSTLLYPLVSLAGGALEMLRPGRVSYLYLFRKL
jgi:trans-aconitate methyltransferase